MNPELIIELKYDIDSSFKYPRTLIVSHEILKIACDFLLLYLPIFFTIFLYNNLLFKDIKCYFQNGK